MKKTLFIALFLTLAIPAFANASWYNPISWFSFLHPKPQIIEKIIYIQATSTVQITPSESTSSPKVETVIKTPVKIEKKSVVTPTVKIPAPVVVQTPNVPTISQADLDSMYLDIMTKYDKFKEGLVNDKGRYNSSNGSPASIDYGLFIVDELAKINDNIGTLDKINTTKTYSQLKSLDADLSSIKSEIAQRYALYIKDDTRYQAVKYFADNQYHLNELGTHAQANELLVKYDKTFGTNYAVQFLGMKTLQETLEFAEIFMSANSI